MPRPPTLRSASSSERSTAPPDNTSSIADLPSGPRAVRYGISPMFATWASGSPGLFGGVGAWGAAGGAGARGRGAGLGVCAATAVGAARGRRRRAGRAHDLANEPVGDLLDRRASRPVDLPQVHDDRDVQQHGERENDREEAIDLGGDAAADRKRKLGTRLRRRRAQELEQHGRVADGHLAARPVGQRDRTRRGVRGARVDAGHGGAVGDARGHAAREAEGVAAAAFLEQTPALGRVVPRDDERALRRRSDGDVAGAREQALLDDPAAVNDADAKHAALATRRAVRGNGG